MTKLSKPTRRSDWSSLHTRGSEAEAALSCDLRKHVSVHKLDLILATPMNIRKDCGLLIREFANIGSYQKLQIVTIQFWIRHKHSKINSCIMTGYVYDALDTANREIRLLVVQPASQGLEKLVHCDLKRISLCDKNVAKYKTISYAWGVGRERDETATLLVAGQPLIVPKNSERAIRRFQVREKSVVLWCDAVCINQHDREAEKPAHVRYMSLVYSRSQGNLVYLGEDTDGTAALAFSTIGRLRDEGKSMLLDLNYETSANDAEVRALTSLFSRPWFRRAWVVQEVVLGGHSECYLGEQKIMLKAFIDTALNVKRGGKGQNENFWMSRKFSPETTIAIENLINLHHLREQYAKGIDLKKKPDIAELIPCSREASDPRDMVYSIIGLLDPSADRRLPPRLAIRYNDSVANVYRSTTRYSLAQRDSPYILYQVAHRTDSELEDSGFASWIPQWHRTMEEGAPSQLSNEFHCWPHNELIEPKDKCEDSEPNVLRLDGIVIDVVTAVTKPLKEEEAHKSRELHEFVTAAQEITRQALLAMGSDQDVDDAIAETLLAGCNTSFKLSTPEDLKAYQFFLERLEELVHSDSDTTLPKGMLPAHKGRIHFYNKLVTVCTWRRFCAIQSGHIGLAPRATRVGDVVVALRNGDWPYVLRPVGREQYQFLGQAYLRGYMQGEVVQECKGRKRKVEQFSMV